MSQNEINGEEADGIAYNVRLDGEFWIATAKHPNGDTRSEGWRDTTDGALDVSLASEIVERMISNLRNDNPPEA